MLVITVAKTRLCVLALFLCKKVTQGKMLGIGMRGVAGINIYCRIIEIVFTGIC